MVFINRFFLRVLHIDQMNVSAACLMLNRKKSMQWSATRFYPHLFCGACFFERVYNCYMQNRLGKKQFRVWLERLLFSDCSFSEALLDSTMFRRLWICYLQNYFIFDWMVLVTLKIGSSPHINKIGRQW